MYILALGCHMAKDQALKTLSLFMTKHICEYRVKQTLLWHFPQQCLDVKRRFRTCHVTPPLPSRCWRSCYPIWHLFQQHTEGTATSCCWCAAAFPSPRLQLDLANTGEQHRRGGSQTAEMSLVKCYLSYKHLGMSFPPSSGSKIDLNYFSSHCLWLLLRLV